jgi:hypoxanthine-DNA glycosylase
VGERISSFAPVIQAGARLLILGSMPGEVSLREDQYYAHPRNRFWTVMGELFGAGRQLPYPDRLQVLNHAGVALWDVLQHCERQGSLDGSIVANSEVPNDFAGLLREHASIRAILFNGQKAEATFRRRVVPKLQPSVMERVKFQVLPSTSPANAGTNDLTLVSAWRDALEKAG